MIEPSKVLSRQWAFCETLVVPAPVTRVPSRGWFTPNIVRFEFRYARGRWGMLSWLASGPWVDDVWPEPVSGEPDVVVHGDSGGYYGAEDRERYIDSEPGYEEPGVPEWVTALAAQRIALLPVPPETWEGEER